MVAVGLIPDAAPPGVAAGDATLTPKSRVEIMTKEQARHASSDRPAIMGHVKARSTDATPEELDALSLSTGDRTRQYVAMNRRTAPETLRRLACDRLSSVRAEAYKNPSTPKDVKDAMEQARETSDYLHEAFASHSKNIEVLRRVSNYGMHKSSWRAGWILARNPACTPDILLCLMRSQDPKVRREIARLEICPAPVLAELSRDKDQDVREVCARRMHTPKKCLAALASDEWWEVRANAAGNRNTPPEALALMTVDSCYVLEAVAGNTSATPETLRFLLDYDDGDIEIALAGNPSSPEDVLDILSECENARARECVAINPSTPTAIVNVLAEDWNISVRSAAVAALVARGDA